MAKGIKTIWIDSDTPESLGNKVIKDDIEIATVPNGVQEYKDPDVVVNRQYKYVIQSYTATGQSTDEVLGDNLNYYTIVEATGLKPIMNNFRILEAEPTKVYFDTPLGSVVGINANDFTISGKSISGVDTTNNFFTVTVGFNYWDNNHIRKEAGNSDGCYDFTIQPITNKDFAQPTAAIQKYVSVLGSGDHSGSSALNEYSGTEMIAAFATGTHYHMRAGNYGDLYMLINTMNSTPTNPMIIEGYETTPGDSPDINWDISTNIFDSNIMPLLSRASGTNAGLAVYASDYVIIKNIQIENYVNYNLSSSGGSSYTQLDNVYVRDSNINFSFQGYENGHRITNCMGLNGAATSFGLAANYSLMENIESYCNTNASDTDYYIAVDGINNISLNSLSHKTVVTTQAGHGYSIQTEAPTEPDLRNTEYNLAQDHTSINISKGCEFRHTGVKYNVIRNIVSYGEGEAASYAGGVIFRDNASYNIAENPKTDLEIGASHITFEETGEVGIGGGHNNTVINGLFKNGGQGVYKRIWPGGTAGVSANDNKIYNCTFIDVPSLFYNSDGNMSSANCEFYGNSMSGVTNFENGAGSADGWTLDYNNFFDGFTAQGSNSSTFDPQFDGDYKPGNDDIIRVPKIINIDALKSERADLTASGYLIGLNE